MIRTHCLGYLLLGTALGIVIIVVEGVGGSCICTTRLFCGVS